MKKSNITIQIEDEKLKALRLFAGRKDTDIDAELEDALQKLYEKYVPKDARDYIELALGEAKATVNPKPSKPATPKPEPKKPDIPTAATNTGTYEPAKASQP